MKTNVKEVRVLKPIENDSYVFVLEDLELAFPEKQLEVITKRWNKGENVFDIADSVERDPDEVFLALFHQARLGETTRKFKGLYE